jgi:hypothetical protein
LLIASFRSKHFQRMIEFFPHAFAQGCM